ncbi:MULTISPECIES: hypothetical protein [Bradyrhizobium]|uniref:hypothetical protein n=1 Tax=Bradyrhizobium TaxID=374 RepID=UPI001E43B0E7|nr:MULTISPECIES: hypothetical protein [Bradyrhizobium]MCD9824403.1 hypothetical protein [Bradyrhizobium japonicum]MCD9897175.1 hypothetical protein [Bradyrhizobium japonicum]MEB2678260.1 hypothetical protein [Bradyrhizobium japonicum]WLB30465.1 hypothetical protein QIH85_06715 [Bradyrhizobium japonicum]WRI88498.1 hypothetical protein R3F75_42880 [Bradyrhizobium japonicum]
MSRKTADHNHQTLLSVLVAMLKCLADRLGDNVVKAIRNTVMALTFVGVAGSNMFWNFMNDYIACGLALAASVTAGLCVERVFIERSRREMIRLHGADWHSAEDQQPGA